MTQKIKKQAAALEYGAGLMIIFGLTALALCAVGVYGLMSHSVVERRHEIGIRTALGATPSQLVSSVTRRGMLLTAIGVAIGIPSALVLAQLLSGLIYGVNPWDSAIFVTAPALLVAITAIACYIPARRAVKVDPLAALHYE